MITSLLKRRGILEEHESELRLREKDLLERLAIALNRFGQDVNPEDLQRFGEAREQIDGFFLLVVAGEFNSGKSSFINALLGERILPEGVTPTTDRINILKHGIEKSEDPIEPYVLVRTYPSPVLEELNIVDTPGTNAIIRRHEELTKNYIPRCDLVLFVTSADRPFTESERLFLEQISQQWGKKIVFIINKVDILTDPKEVEEVRLYVQTNAEALLKTKVDLFEVSAKEALSARSAQDVKKLERSGFTRLEDYLIHTLDKKERVKLKLLNPLNIGLRLAVSYKEVAFERLKLLATDIVAIENVDRQLAAFHEEMMQDYRPRLKMVESYLDDLEKRGNAFFDDTVRLKNIRMLLSKEKIRMDFENLVLADTPRRIEEEVERIIDWIIQRHLKLWQDVNQYIDRRQLSRHRENLIGEAGQVFHYNREALLNSIGRLSSDVIKGYNREAEARAMANEVRDAFTTTALAEAGAIGVGALLVILTHGALADFTGILAASLIAAGGFYIIPAKRKRVKKEFKKKIDQLRLQLTQTLDRQVNHQLMQSSEQINETLAPYRRFVKMHQEQLTEAQAELVTLENSLLRLKAEIERL